LNTLGTSRILILKNVTKNVYIYVHQMNNWHLSSLLTAKIMYT